VACASETRFSADSDALRDAKEEVDKKKEDGGSDDANDKDEEDEEGVFCGYVFFLVFCSCAEVPASSKEKTVANNNALLGLTETIIMTDRQ
jgi:hypothetical protein